MRGIAEITLVLVALTAGVVAVAGAEVVGDVTGDGEVDAQDIQIVINAVLGHEVPEKYQPDVNWSGEVDAQDIQIVINAVLGHTVEVPRMPDFITDEVPAGQAEAELVGAGFEAVEIEGDPDQVVVEQDPPAGGILGPDRMISLFSEGFEGLRIDIDPERPMQGEEVEVVLKGLPEEFSLPQWNVAWGIRLEGDRDVFVNPEGTTELTLELPPNETVDLILIRVVVIDPEGSQVDVLEREVEVN